MTKKEWLKLEYSYLLVDETSSNNLCPFCNGGHGHEKSFSVTRRMDGLIYHCYRASCSEGDGFVPTSARLLQDEKRPSKKPDEPYTGEYLPLEYSDLEYFGKRFDLWSIPPMSVGISGRDEYVQAVLGLYGQTRGYAIRRRGWSDRTGSEWPSNRRRVAYGPKTKLYMNNREEIAQSIYLPSVYPSSSQQFLPDADKRPLVLVEDVISAMKVAQAGHLSVALLGTHLETRRVHELSKLSPTEVIFALDADATETSLRLARKWGLAFPAVRVAILMEDLKDIPAEDIDAALRLA